MKRYDDVHAFGRTMLEGEKVALRTLQSEDLPQLVKWWNSSAHAVDQRGTLISTPDAQTVTMFEQWSANDRASGCGYSITADGALIGHLTVWGIGLPARIATLAIIIGPDFQNMGYGTDALRVGLRIAFDELGAHKAEINAWEFNTRALHVYKSLGFVEEGRRRAAVFHNGQFFDEVSLGMLREEYDR